MLTRQFQNLNVSINIPSPLQSVGPLPVSITYVDRVVDSEGNQVGEAYQHQRNLIPDDMTPELLSELNAHLSSIGHKLVPIAEE